MSNEFGRRLDIVFYLAVFAASICVILFGIGILGYQIVLWLRDGYWTEIPVSDFLAVIPLKPEGARGLQKILDGIWALPASAAAIAVGVTSFAIAAYSKEVNP